MYEKTLYNIIIPHFFWGIKQINNILTSFYPKY